MKLTPELKDKIEKYFDEISDEELYDILTKKYNAIILDADEIGDIVTNRNGTEITGKILEDNGFVKMPHHHIDTYFYGKSLGTVEDPSIEVCLTDHYVKILVNKHREIGYHLEAPIYTVEQLNKDLERGNIDLVINVKD